MGHSTRTAACRSRKGYHATAHIPAHCSFRHSRPSFPCNSLQTLTLSCQPVYLLFSACHSRRSRPCRILTEAHTAAPSGPFYSSSPVPRTSCCRHSRYCIFPDRGTGQSGCKDTGTPMSLYHKSCRAARSADGFRNWIRFRHSRQSGRGKDVELQRYRCPLPCLPPVRGYSVWKESTAPMGLRQTGYTRNCCRYGMPLVLPPSRLRQHILPSGVFP